MNRVSRLTFAFAWIALISLPLTPAEAQEKQAAAEGQKSSSVGPTDKTDADKVSTSGKTASKTKWMALADHWEKCEFGGDGQITIKDGLINMEFGSPLTGVRWSGPFDGDAKEKKTGDKAKQPPVLPRDNYELRWECRRDKGVDFMCAMTFPVAKKAVSLVMGGWGGGITGISSIDGSDASENNTTMFQAYDNDTWYKARVRVETTKITVWVDDVELFDHPRGDYDFDVRFEMDLCTPLGIANFESDSQIRNIQIRRLAASEIAKEESEDQ